MLHSLPGAPGERPTPLDTVLGYPVVTAITLLATLDELRLKPWERMTEFMPVGDYLKRLDEKLVTEFEQPHIDQLKMETERFAPVPQMATFKTEKGDAFAGSRLPGRSWVTTFPYVKLADVYYTLFVAEMKHNACEEGSGLSIAPPSGGPNKADKEHDDPWLACAVREFEDELGLTPKEVVPLGDHPYLVSGGQQPTTYRLYLGELDPASEKQNARLDRTEHLRVLAATFEDWMEIITTHQGVESCTLGATLLGFNEVIGYIA